MFLEKLNLIFISIMIMIFMINFSNSYSKLISLIIFLTVMLSLFISIESKNSWLGFSLFLMMVGGLMVLFMLVASIMPKMITSANFSEFYMLMFVFPLMMLNNFNNNKMMNPNHSIFSKMQITFMIICILNIILIMLSKLINMPMKPFRSSI